MFQFPPSRSPTQMAWGAGITAGSHGEGEAHGTRRPKLSCPPVVPQACRGYCAKTPGRTSHCTSQPQLVEWIATDSAPAIDLAGPPTPPERGTRMNSAEITRHRFLCDHFLFGLCMPGRIRSLADSSSGVSDLPADPAHRAFYFSGVWMRERVGVGGGGEGEGRVLIGGVFLFVVWLCCRSKTRDGGRMGWNTANAPRDTASRLRGGCPLFPPDEGDAKGHLHKPHRRAKQ